MYAEHRRWVVCRFQPVFTHNCSKEAVLLYLSDSINGLPTWEISRWSSVRSSLTGQDSRLPTPLRGLTVWPQAESRTSTNSQDMHLYTKLTQFELRVRGAYCRGQPPAACQGPNVLSATRCITTKPVNEKRESSVMVVCRFELAPLQVDGSVT